MTGTINLADLEQIREKLGGTPASKTPLSDEVLLAKIEKLIELPYELSLPLEQEFTLFALHPDRWVKS